jgi:hypothetical protein
MTFSPSDSLTGSENKKGIRMTISDSGWKGFAETPRPTGRNKRNTLYQLRRYVIFMREDPNASPDSFGAYPYSGYVDYLTGPDGLGVACDINEPHPDDTALAAQIPEFLTHSITVRYDPRIDVRLIIRYPNYETGANRYFYIRTVVNPDFEWHYYRIGAEEIVEFPQP